jgi:hypothetical protein
MPFAFCACNACLARPVAVRLRVQARLVLGRSGTALVGSGPGRSFALSPKTKTSLLVELQTLARIAVDLVS